MIGRCMIYIFCSYLVPDNLLLIATSNRRHLLPELKSDNEGVVIEDHHLHYSDTVNEMISLSDRFGLWISFYSIDQAVYLEIAEHWVNIPVPS